VANEWRKLWQFARFTIAAASTGSFQRALQYSFGNMVSLFPAGARIDRNTRRRKNILPRPLARRVRRFPGEGEREVDTAKPIFEILVVLCFDSHQMPTQRFTQIQRKHGDAVFSAFRVAHGNLCKRKIDVFHPEPNAFHQAQAADAAALVILLAMATAILPRGS
jgi:hypothetical protein